MSSFQRGPQLQHVYRLNCAKLKPSSLSDLSLCLAGIVLIVVTASCDHEHKREARIVEMLLTNADAWLTNNSLAGQAACEVLFLNGDPQLDVVGIVAPDQQDAFVAAMSDNPIQPSRVRFWREKPTYSFGEIVVPEASLAPREKLETESKDKLLRTVSLRK